MKPMFLEQINAGIAVKILVNTWRFMDRSKHAILNQIPLSSSGNWEITVHFVSQNSKKSP